MSYQNECAYLPSDLLDSDDDVAPVTTKATKSLNNSFSKLYDNNSDAKTADNSSNEGKNASTEFGSSIFSVQPFEEKPFRYTDLPENSIVGWKCSSCENFNSKVREDCGKCEKVRIISEDVDITKAERRAMKQKRTPKVGHVVKTEDGKTLGVTRGDRVVEFQEYNHALDNRSNKRKAYGNKKKREVGNWTCQGCFNQNFSFRQNCNNCWMSQNESMQILYGQNQQQMNMYSQPCQMQGQMYQQPGMFYPQQAQQQFMPQQFAPQQQFGQYQQF